MTTLFSPSVVAHHTAVPRGRVALVALWVTQIALAGMFLMSGSMKLSGAPEMIALFDAIGIGQWFRYLTGTIEVAAAVALLVPSLAVFGALVLVPTMLAAIAIHLFIVGGSAMIAAVLLAGALVVTWARREQLARVVSRA